MKREIFPMIKNKKGFTLIEIIIVLVVIAIVAAIAIPSLIGYIDKAKKSKALSECHDVVQAAQTVSIQLYGQNKLDNKNVLMQTEYKDKIISLSETSGNILSIDIDPSSGTILKLSYLSSEYFSVNYDATTEPNYTIDTVTSASAPDYNAEADKILIQSNILTTISQRNKQTQALQKAFLAEYNNSYPILSSEEQEMMTSLNFSSPGTLNWRPIISSTGEVFLAGSTADITKPNPLSYVIYYNGNYYYWFHYNVVKSSYVSDSNFNIQLLDNTKTTLGVNDTTGAWLVYVN